jgi:hypothetical protein
LNVKDKSALLRIVFVSKSDYEFQFFKDQTLEKIANIDIQHTFDGDEAQDLVNSATKVILIACDTVGKTLVSNLYSGIKAPSNIIGIINYCGNLEASIKFF